MRVTGLLGIVLAFATAAPAAAKAVFVTMSGIVQTSGAVDPGLAFGSGNAISGRWRVDIAAGAPFDVPLAGLTGLQRVYAFSVTGGRVRIDGAGGPTRFTQLAASRGAVLVLDNYAFSGPFRLDQVAVIDGARYDGGLVETYGVSGAGPAGTFLRNFSFGKNAFGNIAVPPTMVTSLGRPDVAAIFGNGAQSFANFAMGTGTPASAAEFAGLPVSSFGVIGPVFTVTAVPEPGSWAMLLAGFGIVGAVLRRRAATSVAAAAV